MKWLIWIYYFLFFNRREQTGFVILRYLECFCHFSERVVSLWKWQALHFCKKWNWKGIRWGWMIYSSSSEFVVSYNMFSNIWNILSYFSNYHILKYYSYRTNETKCNGLLLMCKRWFKKCKATYFKLMFFQKNIYFFLDKKTRVKACDLRYLPNSTLFFTQKYNFYYIQCQKRI